MRGIRSATKRKALFTWLNERRYDIIFLQETYSTADVEDIWRTQWRGKLFFAHGSNHSCGVMVLVRSDLDFNPRTISCDDEGRSIIIEAEVQGSPFLFVWIVKNGIWFYLWTDSKRCYNPTKATWYEKGEKSNKFFLNLETHKKAKSSVRKVFDDNGVLITDPKKILQEIQNFYSNLCERLRL